MRTDGKGGGRPGRRPVLWAVGGGKGGAGKSLIASNLGILLSRAGRRVLLVDVDLGAANLHTLVGETESHMPLSSFIKGEVNDLSEVISATGMPNLDLVSGSMDSMDAANLNGTRVAHLRDSLEKTDHDYVLMDLGPGTSNNTLDFFLLADRGILVVTPEPTAVENTYRFIKCLLLRLMKQAQEAREGGKLKDILKRIFYESEMSKNLTIAALLDEIREHDRDSWRMLKELMERTRLSVVINQARRPEDNTLGYSVRRACLDFFDVEVDILGHIPFSEKVWESTRLRRPLTVEYADTEPAVQLSSVLDEALVKDAAR
ncbi:MAG: P-loop NTPase [Thermodesulfobacteriota bacterium]